jgi:hypothetical protein
MNTPLDFGEPPGESESAPARERTGWIWAISLGYLILALFVPVSFAILKSGLLQTWGSLTQKAAIQPYLDSLGTADYVASGAVAVLMAAGSLALLRLSRFAFHLYVATFGVSLYATVRLMTNEYERALLGPHGLFQQVLALGLLAATCVYCYATTRRGYLK